HDRVDLRFPRSQKRDLGHPSSWVRLQNHQVTILAAAGMIPKMTAVRKDFELSMTPPLRRA
ncbi:MAG: hypothetical protein WBE38_15780, partial [Terracidiphilus sp.]